jgi:hypothetical protein
MVRFVVRESSIILLEVKRGSSGARVKATPLHHSTSQTSFNFLLVKGSEIRLFDVTGRSKRATCETGFACWSLIWRGSRDKAYARY